MDRAIGQGAGQPRDAGFSGWGGAEVKDVKGLQGRKGFQTDVAHRGVAQVEFGQTRHAGECRHSGVLTAAKARASSSADAASSTAPDSLVAESGSVSSAFAKEAYPGRPNSIRNRNASPLCRPGSRPTSCNAVSTVKAGLTDSAAETGSGAISTTQPKNLSTRAMAWSQDQQRASFGEMQPMGPRHRATKPAAERASAPARQPPKTM
jgi:hypothetical protein